MYAQVLLVQLVALALETLGALASPVLLVVVHVQVVPVRLVAMAIFLIQAVVQAVLRVVAYVRTLLRVLLVKPDTMMMEGVTFVEVVQVIVMFVMTIHIVRFVQQGFTCITMNAMMIVLRKLMLILPRLVQTALQIVKNVPVRLYVLNVALVTFSLQTLAQIVQLIVMFVLTTRIVRHAVQLSTSMKMNVINPALLKLMMIAPPPAQIVLLGVMIVQALHVPLV